MSEPPPARGERALIRRLAPLCPGTDLVPFGDDLAALASRLLWSCDMLMDGVDFRSGEHPWTAVGRKAVAVNLSDCAAMGARPVAALVAVALQDTLTLADAEQLIGGVAAAATEFGCVLRGGDTNSWPQPTVISVTVAAEIPAGREPVRRDGARPGDRLYLSGPVGGSILGRHMTFTPRVELGLRIAATLHPHAMIDLSDGLALDLARICEASGCGARLDAAAVDHLTHPDAAVLAARTGRPPREHALSDGEDFELLVALPPATAAADALKLGLTPVGEVVAGAGLTLRETDGREVPLEPRGWEHFR